MSLGCVWLGLAIPANGYLMQGIQATMLSASIHSPKPCVWDNTRKTCKAQTAATAVPDVGPTD